MRSAGHGVMLCKIFASTRVGASTPTARAITKHAGTVVAPHCTAAQPAPPVIPKPRPPAHNLRAALIARIYELFLLICPLCGGQMRIIAFITFSADIAKILEHI